MRLFLDSNNCENISETTEYLCELLFWVTYRNWTQLVSNIFPCMDISGLFWSHFYKL